jgi:hypothetical protein
MRGVDGESDGQPCHQGGQAQLGRRLRLKYVRFRVHKVSSHMCGRSAIHRRQFNYCGIWTGQLSPLAQETEATPPGLPVLTTACEMSADSVPLPPQ